MAEQIKIKDQIKIKLISHDHTEIQIPQRATDGSACIDIVSLEDAILKPGETKLLSTGLFSEFSKKYVALVFPRSGLSIKQGGSLANCVGVIDSDYRGEWKIGLFNHNPKKLFSHKNDIVIHKGDRVAQFMILQLADVEIAITDELSSSERGTGGFGSTGK